MAGIPWVDARGSERLAVGRNAIDPSNYAMPSGHGKKRIAFLIFRTSSCSTRPGRSPPSRCRCACMASLDGDRKTVIAAEPGPVTAHFRGSLHAPGLHARRPASTRCSSPAAGDAEAVCRSCATSFAPRRDRRPPRRQGLLRPIYWRPPGLFEGRSATTRRNQRRARTRLYPRVQGRGRPHLRAGRQVLELGRHHRRHRPGAGPDRGGPRRETSPVRTPRSWSCTTAAPADNRSSRRCSRSSAPDGPLRALLGLDAQQPDGPLTVEQLPSAPP